MSPTAAASVALCGALSLQACMAHHGNDMLVLSALAVALPAWGRSPHSLASQRVHLRLSLLSLRLHTGAETGRCARRCFGRTQARPAATPGAWRFLAACGSSVEGSLVLKVPVLLPWVPCLRGEPHVTFSALLTPSSCWHLLSSVPLCIQHSSNEFHGPCRAGQTAARCHREPVPKTRRRELCSADAADRGTKLPALSHSPGGGCRIAGAFCRLAQAALSSYLDPKGFLHHTFILSTAAVKHVVSKLAWQAF